MDIKDIWSFFTNFLKFTFTREGREATLAGINPPETFEEAVNQFSKVVKGMKGEDRIYLVNQKTAELFAATLHHNMGRFIRNKWGIWSDACPLRDHMKRRFGVEHPDDISSIIMMCSWQQLNRLPLTPIPFAEACIEYWKSVENQPANKSYTIHVEMGEDGTIRTKKID